MSKRSMLRFRGRSNRGLAIAAVLAVGACTDNSGPGSEAPRPTDTPESFATSSPPQIVVAAGDIATCSTNNDEATAALVDNIAGTVLVLGDNAYPSGTTSEFTNCYDPTWGRHKARTRPVPGNHDYDTPGASGYFTYFGSAAGEAGKGYYSFDLGAWHVIALNSEISKSPTSAQMRWLRTDLAAHPTACTLAYWHKPLYSSTSFAGSGGTIDANFRPLWDTLYAYGVDLVLNGHRHNYERIAPVKPDGTPDANFGIRAIIAGSGGIGGSTITNIVPASEVRDGRTFGVLKLYLYDDSYAWKFVPVAGKTFTDSSSTACHGAPGSATGGVVSASNSTVSAATGTITASSGSSTSAITVTAKDANGNPVSGGTVVLSATGSGNTITQPTGPTNSSGVATGSLSSTVAGTKTVSATIGGVSVTQTATVTVDPGAASALTFTVQPGNTAAGGTITPALKVEVRDQFGNRNTTATNQVTMAIGTNPAQGTLAGSTSVAAVSGVATFSTLSIDQPGAGYTLVASASGLSDATSSAFDVTSPPPVSATLSTLSASPTTITASNGSSTSTITAAIKDTDGHPMSGVIVNFSATGSGNTLTQPVGPTNASGVATGALASTAPETKTVSATADGMAISQTVMVTVVPEASGGISHSLLASGNNVVNQRVYTTTSVAPAPNTLVTVAVVGHNATSAPGSPTLSGGGMSSWTEVASVTFDSLSVPHKRMTIFRALSAAPGSGPITITFPVAVSNCQWIVSQWSGLNISGTNGAGAIVQTGSDRGNGVSTLTAVLAPFGSASNVAYGVVGVNGNGLVVSPGTGFTEIAEQSSGESPRSVLEAESATGNNTVKATWTGLLNAGILGIELRAAGP